ncbi:MAG TPA: glycosyltransferase family 4 protein [Blastocatellia bacterium]|nr:glycosyltransferase family 4 protein [Blastocatellia bacterium]HMV84480.1 glycosyltransferase family 4 protein [Blastocatellia bacterium]HMX28377.1 glycosyltransferase family 4 protein [Blastocatellia bacterium]HMY70900.1 glycosyltransferase family 4 protein [Blastocatellia bacterium]HMZ18863.1 glycosyltransferase family 4 protein [Blastocatellia bacterium]
MFRASIFFLAGVISFLITGWLATAPAWFRSLDVPNARSSHTQPTPRMGGLGIAATFVIILPMLWVMLLGASQNWFRATKFGVALVSYVIIAGVGLVDDMKRIGPLPKYLGQLLAALIALWGEVIFLYFKLPFFGTVNLTWLVGAALTIVWLTGFSNFFNFMDGIDGLAGGVGVIYSLSLAVIAIGTGHRLIGAGCLMLAAACLGFVAHNFPPAKIFMGDVGSLFIGYVLAAFAVMTSSSGERPAPFIAVLLIFGSFIYDATFTLIRRARRGEKLYEAHRSHLYQRLVIAGQSHRQVSLTYYGLSALLGAGGVAYTFAGDWMQMLILAAAGGVLAVFTLYVYWYEAAAQRAKSVLVSEVPAEAAAVNAAEG